MIGCYSFRFYNWARGKAPA